MVTMYISLRTLFNPSLSKKAMTTRCTSDTRPDLALHGGNSIKNMIGSVDKMETQIIDQVKSIKVNLTKADDYIMAM